MTSSQVTNSQGVSLTNFMNSQQFTGKTEKVGFKESFMNSEKKYNSPTKETATEKPQEFENDIQKPVEVTSKVKPEKEITSKEETREPETQDVEDTLKAVKEIVDAIEESLDVSAEEIESALVTLGLAPLELLIPENIADVTVEITGEDMLSLVTDENLYTKVNELKETVGNIAEQLCDLLGVEPKELEEAINNEQLGTQQMIFEVQESQEASETVTTVVSEDIAGKIEVQNDLLPRETVLPKKQDNIEKTEPENKVSKIEVEPVKTSNIQNTQNFEKESFNENGESELAKENDMDFFKSEEAMDVTKNAAPLSFVENLVNKTREVLNSQNGQDVFTTVDTEKILNQIIEQIKLKVTEDNTEVSLKLHPESLGNVNVKVTTNTQGVVSAQITAQNESVKAIIESQAVVLREALEAKGVTVEAVEVMVGTHEFERNLSDNERHGEQGGEKKQKVRRIDLSAMEDEPEDEEMNLQREIMIQNGNTIDYTV